MPSCDASKRLLLTSQLAVRLLTVLLWCDLETSGLDPRQGVILEIGLALSDDDLNIVSEDSWVVQPPSMAVFDRAVPEVIQMHMDNGLLPELMAGNGCSLSEATSLAMRWWADKVDYRMLATPNDEKLPMCGSTIGFDRKWLEQHCSMISDLFHYRSIDVSSIKELIRRWWPEALFPSSAVKPHRSLADIHNSIAELAHYRDVLGLGTKPTDSSKFDTTKIFATGDK